jgi:hypothetical protein
LDHLPTDVHAARGNAVPNKKMSTQLFSSKSDVKVFHNSSQESIRGFPCGSLYEIEAFTRLRFGIDNYGKTISRKGFLAMKHEFCEHVTQDARKRILSLGGIFGVDMIKAWRFTIIGSNYTLEIWHASGKQPLTNGRLKQPQTEQSRWKAPLNIL